VLPERQYDVAKPGKMVASCVVPPDATLLKTGKLRNNRNEG